MTPDKIIYATSISQVHYFESIGEGYRTEAHIYALVTRVTKKRKTIFLIVTDGTAKIQLVAEKNDLSKDLWMSVKNIQTSTRISVKGYVGHTQINRLSIFVRDIVEGGSNLPAFANATSIVEIGNRILMPVIRKIVSHFLDNQGFKEVATKQLSPKWKETSVTPLRVSYKGFGMPVYLVPSPSTQLMKDLTTSGYPKIYSYSKCFTTVYRSDFDSTESEIIMGKMLNCSKNEIFPLLYNCYKQVVAQLTRIPNRKFIVPEEYQVVECQEIPIHHESSQIQIHICSLGNISDELFGGRKVQVFALFIPTQSYDGRQREVLMDGSTIMICDGSIEVFDDNFCVITFTYHINRLVRLLHDFAYPDFVPIYRTLTNLNL